MALVLTVVLIFCTDQLHYYNITLHRLLTPLCRAAPGKLTNAVLILFKRIVLLNVTVTYRDRDMPVTFRTYVVGMFL